MKWMRLYTVPGDGTFELIVDASSKEEATRKFEEERRKYKFGYFCEVPRTESLLK